MKKTIFCLLAILFPLLTLFAKPALKSHPLGIGGQLADIPFAHVLNWKTNVTGLSGFGTKPILLDFFATWCGGCITGLKTLDSLQLEFGDKIQIIVVAYEPMAIVSKFLAKNKSMAGIHLPFVTDDSVLCDLFLHKLLPHEVWLDANRNVMAITQPQLVTAENIQKLLTDAHFSLPLKKDVLDFDRQKPLLEDGNGGDKNMLRYRSTITGFLDGLGTMAGNVTDTASKTKRIFYTDYPLVKLYLAALGSSLPPNRVVLEVMDSSRFILRDGLATEKNSFSYEQVVPSGTNKTKSREWMRQDLDRYFSLHGKLEKRMVECYVLAIDSLQPVQLNLPSETAQNEGASDPVTLGALVNMLNADDTDNAPPIFLVAAGCEKKPAPVFTPAMENLGFLKKEFARYGITITKTERLLELLVISDH